MKILRCIGKAVLSFLGDVLGIIFFLFGLLYALVRGIFFFIVSPFKNRKHTHSRYHQDFPDKRALWCGPHVDHAPYNVIKDNQLPIEYVKQPKDDAGYFIYKDILLVFNEPLTFCPALNLWLFFENEYDAANAVLNDSVEMGDFMSEPLVLEEAKIYLLQQFCEKFSEHKCEKIVFFYEKESEKDVPQNSEDFVVYEKDGLGQAIKEFINTH